jgi:hypothetical protein
VPQLKDSAAALESALLKQNLEVIPTQYAALCAAIDAALVNAGHDI